MTCSEVERVLPEMIDGSENAEFQAHVKSCASCSELVSDLHRIASEARELAASHEPPERLWVKIAAELRAEGVIREPEAAPPVLVSPKRRWNAWWLVPVAASLVATASYLSTHRTSGAPQVAVQSSPATTAAPSPPASQNTTPAVGAAPSKAGSQVAASKAPKTANPIDGQSAPMATVSTDDGQLLSHIGRRAPDMQATFESQLQAVNAYIRDVETYLRQNPDDEEARQQLMEAYDQKAMLYQMALDHVQ